MSSVGFNSTLRSSARIGDYTRLTNPLLHAASMNPNFSDIISGYNDAELFQAFQETNKQLMLIKLENQVFENFLAKNDPKLLIGVTKAMERTRKAPRIQFASLSSREAERFSIMRSREAEGVSISSIFEDINSYQTITSFSRQGGVSQRTAASARSSTEYQVNSAVKIELTEKVCEEIRQTSEKIEKRTKKEMRLLNATIAQLRAENDEILNAKEKFGQYVASLTGESMLSRVPAEKFIKYFEDWIKNGTVLMGTMKLRISSMKQQYQQQKATLAQKADLRGVLSPVDFELLQIGNKEKTEQVEERNRQLIELKRITGDAALNLTKQRKELMEAENHLKIIVDQTDNTQKRLDQSERKIEIVSKEVIDFKEKLEALKEKGQIFRAPNTMDYLGIKQELFGMEKEEKLLLRQIRILMMKLRSVKKK